MGLVIMTQMKTIFKYRCSCGKSNFLRIHESHANCNHCETSLPVSLNGVIAFNQKTSNQNSYFDGIYKAGYENAVDRYQSDAGLYSNSVSRPEIYLNLAGFDVNQYIESLSILDVACGSGWVTAGLMQNEN